MSDSRTPCPIHGLAATDTQHCMECCGCWTYEAPCARFTFNADALFRFLADLNWLCQQELGYTGLGHCTEVRAKAGRTRVLISFEIAHRDRPMRVAVRKSLIHRFDDFVIFDFKSMIDDRLVWSICEDVEPRYANSPDERYTNLYWTCDRCGGDAINAVSASNGCRSCG